MILCGGFATRLEPITLFVPKPLLPVGGRPLLDYIVENLNEVGIGRIIFSTNRKFADQFEYWIKHRIVSGAMDNIGIVIEPTMNDGEKFGAIKGIDYTIEKAELKNDLMVIAGDNFYSFGLKGIVDSFNKSRKPTVALHDIGSKEEAKRFGVMMVDGDKVVGMEEKPQEPKSTLVSTGIYLFPKETLPRFSEYIGSGNNVDAPGYFMQWLLKNEDVRAVVCKGEWFDIGNIDTYRKVFEKYQKK